MIFIAAFALLLLFTSSTSSVPDEQLKEERDLARVREEPHEQQPWIIGGSITPTGGFEYFVWVDAYHYAVCGGVLVGPNIVMMAGHCKSDELSVVVNGYDESKSDNLNWHQHACVVTNDVQYPGYNGKTWKNDIMLLKLSSPVYDVDYIQMNFDNNYPPAGEDVSVMGLGRTEAGTCYSKVIVQALDSNVCNAKYNKGGLTVPVSIMQCIGTNAGGKDSCIGDSGGPLVDSNDLLAGIASWTVGCAKNEYPGV